MTKVSSLILLVNFWNHGIKMHGLIDGLSIDAASNDDDVATATASSKKRRFNDTEYWKALLLEKHPTHWRSKEKYLLWRLRYRYKGYWIYGSFQVHGQTKNCIMPDRPKVIRDSIASPDGIVNYETLTQRLDEEVDSLNSICTSYEQFYASYKPSEML